MKKNFKALIFICILFTLISCVSTGGIQVTKLGDLPKEIDLKNLPTQEQYPDSDGVVLYENIIYDVDYVPSVGIETYKTYHKVYRVFRDEESFMENYVYLNDKTVFKTFAARTIKPDGQTHELTERDIYYLTVMKKSEDYEGKNQSATYNIPQVKKGDLIEIKYTVVNSYFYFTDKYWVQSSIPKKYSRFEIRLPNFIFDPPHPYKFEYIVKNIQMPEPEYKKGFGDSGDRVYIWEKKDIPKLKKEAGMGRRSLYQGYINLRLSSWSSWKTFSRKHYKRFYEPFLDDMSSNDKEVIADLNSKLLKGKKNDLDKIRTLYNHVQKYHYSNTHVYFGHGYKPNEIKTIVERGYGDCKDHTVVLTALLRNAGFQAWPTLIKTGRGEGVDTKFATDIFDHIIVKVYLKDGQTIWMDPTASNTPFGKLPVMCEDSYSLEIRPKNKEDRKKIRLVKTPASNYSDNHIDQKVELMIKKDSVTMIASLSSGGFFAESSRYDLKDQSEHITKRVIKKSLSSLFFDSDIKDLKIKNLNDLEKPLLMNFSIEKNITGHKKIGAMLNNAMPIPSDLNVMYYKNRTKPIKLGYNYSRRSKINIKYDPNEFSSLISSEHLNKEFSFKNGFFWKISGSTKPGEISCVIEYAQKTKEVKAADVPEYLKTLYSIIRYQIESISSSFIVRKTKTEEAKPEEPALEKTTENGNEEQSNEKIEEKSANKKEEEK